MERGRLTSSTNAAAYRRLAPFYDQLMGSIDYSLWGNFIDWVVARFDIQPQRVLDVGCGTGKLALMLARRGWRVTGCDAAPEMLSRVRRRRRRRKVQLVAADWTRLPFRPAFDLACAFFDSFNCILHRTELRAALRSVADVVVPGGAFAFDLVTAHAIEVYFGNESWEETFPRFRVCWTSQYDPARGVCTVRIEVVPKDSSGEATPLDLQFHERVWTLPTVERLAKRAGWDVVWTGDVKTTEPSTADTERLGVVLRKHQGGTRK